MPSDLKLSVHSVTPDVTLTLSDPYIGSAYSPQVDVSEIEGGHEVTITHKAPSGIITDTFDVLDGVDGTDGIDGVSPTVEIESTTYAHTITITDVDGAHSYTVDTYADEEEARATAESSRVAAESSRVTAEQARATAESSRAAAESARVTAEASRATAEQSRAAAETARESAESTRATVETARTTAESARAIAEQGRATTEQSRATAETARASAESGRVSAETARVSAENARASAESARVTAESARASAETSRANAETARSNAELARATEWAEIESEAQSTIDAAQDAADDATAAAAEARAASAATWLSGNVLFGELSEAAVLTTDDAYAAPPKSVEVFGVSTQVTTTGKNLFNKNGDNLGYWGLDGILHESTSRYWRIPVQEGDVIRAVTNAAGYVGVTNPMFSNGEVVGNAPRTSITNGLMFTVPAGVDELCGNFSSGGFDAAIVTKNNSDLTYEPYVGGKAAPNQDYPQPIESVDDLTLTFAGKNLFDVDHVHALLLSAATYSVSDKSITVTKTAQSAACVILVELPTIVGTSVTYTLAANTTSSGAMLCLGYCDSNGSNRTQITRSDAMKNPAITASVNVPDGKVAAAWLYPDFANATISSCVFSNIQLELGTAATAYQPYVGTSVQIPLSNHIARSLPDGTRDTLTLSYEGPAQTAGYGIFRKTLTQNVQAYDMGDITWTYVTNWRSSNVFRCNIPTTSSVMCTAYPKSAGAYTPTDDSYMSNVGSWTTAGNLVVRDDSYTTVADFTAAVAGQEIQYALAEPITHDLGTVELPILPCPLTAWADGGSAQPTIRLEYERALSIVIPRIEAQLADMATS